MPAPSAADAATITIEHLARLACPVCHGSFALDAQSILCTQCQRRYPIQDGIPVLIADRAIQPNAIQPKL